MIIWIHNKKKVAQRFRYDINNPFIYRTINGVQTRSFTILKDRTQRHFLIFLSLEKIINSSPSFIYISFKCAKLWKVIISFGTRNSICVKITEFVVAIFSEFSRIFNVLLIKVIFSWIHPFQFFGKPWFVIFLIYFFFWVKKSTIDLRSKKKTSINFSYIRFGSSWNKGKQVKSVVEISLRKQLIFISIIWCLYTAGCSSWKPLKSKTANIGKWSDISEVNIIPRKKLQILFVNILFIKVAVEFSYSCQLCNYRSRKPYYNFRQQCWQSKTSDDFFDQKEYYDCRKS